MQNKSPKHPQTLIQHGSASVPIDVKIAPLIRELWRGNIFTNASCEEHEGTDKVWVEFRDPDAARNFLNRVIPHDPQAGSLWRRAADWGFGSTMPQAMHLRGGDWEYHVSVRDISFDESTQTFMAEQRGFLLSVSVLFPRSDLPAVTKNLRHFNDTSQYP